jgi:hypothetical protein
MRRRGSVLALAILRVREPDSQSGMLPRGPVIAHISSETSGLRLAATTRKHWHGRIVGVKLSAGEHMLLKSHRSTERVTHLLRLPIRPAWSARSQQPGERISPTGDRAVNDQRTSRQAHVPAAPARQGHARSDGMARALQSPQEADDASSIVFRFF